MPTKLNDFTVHHDLLIVIELFVYRVNVDMKSRESSVAEWLVSLTLNHLAPLRVGSNPGLTGSDFHEGKPPGWLAEGRWFYPDA